MLEATARTKEEARAAFVAAHEATRVLLADGRMVRIVVEEVDPDLRLRLLAFYRGPVLQQVSEQARIDGQRYTRPVWHETFREQFLGSRFIMVAGCPIEVPVSTGNLGVRRLGEYVDQVIAEAVMEWGVSFTFENDERAAVLSALGAGGGQ